MPRPRACDSCDVGDSAWSWFLDEGHVSNPFLYIKTGMLCRNICIESTWNTLLEKITSIYEGFTHHESMSNSRPP